MGEHHELLLRHLRQRLMKKGFKEDKNPMPTFRPDIFARKFSRKNVLIEEIVVEAEIKSTLHSPHTIHQMVLMQEYLDHQKKKKIKAQGTLLVPIGPEIYRWAKSLLESLFPTDCSIKIVQM